MIRIIITIFLIIYSQISFSKIIVTGKMCGLEKSLASNMDAYLDFQQYEFPLKNYDVNAFFICDLQYHPDTPQSERKINLTIYKFIIADGKLELASHNENFYRYKLFVQTINMSREIKNGLSDYVKIEGNIVFPNNKKYLVIEGQYKYNEKSQLVVDAIFKNGNNYYKFTPDNGSFPHMKLTRISDFPVIVEFEKEEKS